MSQPSISWWQKYGTLAQMAQAAVALLGFVAILFESAYLATYSTDSQEWLKASMKSAGVTPPDCKLGKT